MNRWIIRGMYLRALKKEFPNMTLTELLNIVPKYMKANLIIEYGETITIHE